MPADDPAGTWSATATDPQTLDSARSLVTLPLILDQLGLDPHREYWDEFQQVPRKLAEGTPLKTLGGARSVSAFSMLPP